METKNEGNIEHLQIIKLIDENKHVLENLHALSFGMYYTTISAIENASNSKPEVR